MQLIALWIPLGKHISLSSPLTWYYNLNPLWDKTRGFAPSLIFLSVYFIAVLAIFEAQQVDTTLTPFFAPFPLQSVCICWISTTYLAHCQVSKQWLKGKFVLSMCSSLCCAERKVNRRRLSPAFEKHVENSDDAESDTWVGSWRRNQAKSPPELIFQKALVSINFFPGNLVR